MERIRRRLPQAKGRFEVLDLARLRSVGMFAGKVCSEAKLATNNHQPLIPFMREAKRFSGMWGHEGQVERLVNSKLSEIEECWSRFNIYAKL